LKAIGKKFASAIYECVTLEVVLCWVVTSIVVALSGPFGTFEARPLGWRLGYWAVVIGTAIPISLMCRIFWQEVLDRKGSWLEDFLTIGFLSVVFGPGVVRFNVWLAGPSTTTVMGWEVATLVTFLVGLSIVALRRAVQHSSLRETVQQRDLLLDRIGAPLGARLSRVSSDNHHIRVMTDDGREYRVLMRLRDAIAEITVEKGMCVHRSHWVAEEMIVRGGLENGKEVVKLKCGNSLPVGPKYRVNLVRTGVLAA